MSGFVIPPSKDTEAKRYAYCMAAKAKLIRQTLEALDGVTDTIERRRYNRQKHKPRMDSILAELQKYRRPQTTEFSIADPALCIVGSRLVYPPGITAWGDCLRVTRILQRRLRADKVPWPNERYDVVDLEYARLKAEIPQAVIDEPELPRLAKQSLAPVDPIEDFTTWNPGEADIPQNRLLVAATSLTITNLDNDELVKHRRDQGAGTIGNFTHQFDYRVSGQTGTTAIGGMWGVSTHDTDGNDWQTNSRDAILLFAYDSGQAIYMREMSGLDDDTTTYVHSTRYYATVTRSGASLTTDIYTGGHGVTPFDSLSNTVPAADTYQYQFGVTGWNSSVSGKDSDYDVGNMDLSAGVTTKGNLLGGGVGTQILG